VEYKLHNPALGIIMWSINGSNTLNASVKRQGATITSELHSRREAIV